MAVAVGVVAWKVLEDGSPETSTSTSVEQLPTVAPAQNLETTNSQSPSGAVTVAAQLTMPEMEFDFGFAPQNVYISHVFWLHSTGTDTLKVLQVNPG
jgi:hypothetical protein